MNCKTCSAAMSHIISNNSDYGVWACGRCGTLCSRVPDQGERWHVPELVGECKRFGVILGDLKKNPRAWPMSFLGCEWEAIAECIEPQPGGHERASEDAPRPIS